MLAALASQLFVLCKSFQKACRKLPRSDIMNKLKLSAACRRTLGRPVKTVSAKLRQGRQRYLLGDNLPHLPCTFEELSPSFMVKCHQGLKTSGVMAGTRAAVRATTASYGISSQGGAALMASIQPQGWPYARAFGGDACTHSHT